MLCHWTTETLWWARSDYEVHVRQTHNMIYPCDKMKNIFLYFFTKLKNSPSSAFSLILSMTGKINFQTSKATILPVEFSILNSNKRYYRQQMLLVTAWKGEHCILVILSFSKIDLVFIFQLALITGTGTLEIYPAPPPKLPSKEGSSDSDSKGKYFPKQNSNNFFMKTRKWQRFMKYWWKTGLGVNYF